MGWKFAKKFNCFTIRKNKRLIMKKYAAEIITVIALTVAALFYLTK